ncbi:MAG: LPXTG cell wall anchor domain-containing protein, partial [Methyloprofundus sp.]|nr:LPXTG cell wall anchor domain-containing protein [Methyloprofundus sp.]
FSSTPIYPNFVQIRSKNYKSFDGGEVQIPSLNARSITIDINDSGLGVLSKFIFTSVKQPVNIINKVPYIIGFLLLGIFGYSLLRKKKSVVVR